jgi:hypothetical protein
LLYLFTKSAIKHIVVIIKAYQSWQRHIKFYLTLFSLG